MKETEQAGLRMQRKRASWYKYAKKQSRLSKDRNKLRRLSKEGWKETDQAGLSM